MYDFGKLVILTLFLVGRASAGTVTIDLLAGWWGSDGTRNAGGGSTSANYIAGVANGREHHDYVVADLSGVAGLITGAVLRLFNPTNGYSSPDAAEVYTLFDVSTPIADLIGL